MLLRRCLRGPRSAAVAIPPSREPRGEGIHLRVSIPVAVSPCEIQQRTKGGAEGPAVLSCTVIPLVIPATARAQASCTQSEFPGQKVATVLKSKDWPTSTCPSLRDPKSYANWLDTSRRTRKRSSPLAGVEGERSKSAEGTGGRDQTPRPELVRRFNKSYVITRRPQACWSVFPGRTRLTDTQTHCPTSCTMPASAST